MQTIGCPTCGNPLAESIGYCARCGETALSSETPLSLNENEKALAPRTPFPDTPVTLARAEEGEHDARQPVAVGAGSTAPPAQDPGAVKEPGETESTLRLPGNLTRRKQATSARSVASAKSAPQEPGENETTLRLARKVSRRQLTVSSDIDEADATIQLPHKIIKRQQQKARASADSQPEFQFARSSARASLEEDLLIAVDETAHTEQGEDDEDEVMQSHETWQKVVGHKTTHSMPIVAITPVQKKYAPSKLSTLLKRPPTRSLFWLTTLVLIALLLSGAFGLAVSFGHSVKKAVQNPPPALLVSPATIALGGIVTLRGIHFTPGGIATLDRDQHISLMDTGGESVIQADASGSFSDTVVADPAWLSGVHTLYATDEQTHKQALVPVTVTGPNVLQGPPHLLLSSTALDLGSGDEVTNASKLLALSNAGGGTATWQASVSQPWLQITPRSGSIASGKHLSAIVAVDRSELAPGSYQAAIIFTSNTGQVTLSVTITVTALQPSHEAIMQLSPATLAFEGAARGNAPGQQIITISNPGIQPLTWKASVNDLKWLWTAPSGGTVPAGGRQQITVGVSTDGLASGVYRGQIAFSNQGSQPARGSPQNIYISLTVTPACTLTISTSSLSFQGLHRAAPPSGKSLKIGVASGCKTSQHWIASSSASWLHVSPSSGQTPTNVQVTTSTSGLASGTYHGVLTFANSLGSKMLNVTLTVTPVPCSISGQSALDLQGTAGQAGPVAQNVTIQASGDCAHALTWTTSSSDSSWLSASSSGGLTSSASVNVQANLASLSAGTYNGTVTIAVVDSVTGQAVGTVAVSVMLTAQAPTPPAVPCTLQAPSSGELDFTANAGSDPASPTASFTISVVGSCSGDVTISANSADSWLALSGPVGVASGSTAPFTVTVTAASLASGTYTSTITLTASGGISGNPRSVTVVLTVQSSS